MSHPSAASRLAFESEAADGPPLVGRVDWKERYPWLIQGITIRGDQETARGDGAACGDFRLRGPAAAGKVLTRWDALRDGLGVATVVHSRQVHGTAIRVARSGSTGLLLTPPCDGHLTRDPGVLITVAVADCVPIFMIEPTSRTLGLLHGGWRGVAAGILERGIEEMGSRFGIAPASLELHFGPSISGPRYEVGPEVFEGLGLPVPDSPAHLDLREHLTQRAVAAGVRGEAIGVSEICVHDDPRFFSHRRGDEGRQLAVLGYRGRPGRRE